jgi:hypothetical protein
LAATSFTAARQQRRSPTTMDNQDPQTAELPSLRTDCIRAKRRVWQQALGDYLPVIMFGIAWAVIRTPGATKVQTRQIGGHR